MFEHENNQSSSQTKWSQGEQKESVSLCTKFNVPKMLEDAKTSARVSKSLTVVQSHTIYFLFIVFYSNQAPADFVYCSLY